MAKRSGRYRNLNKRKIKIDIIWALLATLNGTLLTTGIHQSFPIVPHWLQSSAMYRVSPIKWGHCSFIVIVKHILETFDNFGRWNNTSFVHFEKHKNLIFFAKGHYKYVNYFLRGSILAVVLLITFTLKQTTSMLKNHLLLLVFIC